MQKNLPTAKVSIRTRTNLGESPSNLPVHVYAFNTTGQCVAYQILTQADEFLSLTLTAGTYTIAALTGVTSDRYILPNLSDALTTSPLERIDPESEHVEIETGRANITLDNDEYKELALTVNRVVAQVKFSVFDLPENITEAKISFQPLHSILRMDGLFDYTQFEKINIPLVKNDTINLWETNNTFVFPSDGNVTVGIVLTDGKGDRNYAYNTPIEIKANYKYDITAVYKSGNPEIAGTITGTDWAGEEIHEFVFGGKTYRAGDFYRDCYILHVEKDADKNVTLTLLSPKQWESTGTVGVNDLMLKYEHYGIGNWKILSTEEARQLHELCLQNLEQVNNLLSQHGHSTLKQNDEYLCVEKGDEDKVLFFPLKGTFTTTDIIKTNKYKLRLLKKQQLTYY
ncbi:MAG: FimB/Mfa2 family fimbrial subunit [Tannerellaceae bacterium]|jgi:hypothetical protein|nr:FimB/Mfa2 family fimbrial subunit [Tannerellaceae bacterium]